MSEFKDDMKRFNYLKRLFKRYRSVGEIKERLIINHLIVLCNVFGPIVATRLLFYKMVPEDYSALKTYLTFLNLMPNRVTGIRGVNLMSIDIPIDSRVEFILRETI
jgi:hypothetical protein